MSKKNPPTSAQAASVNELKRQIDRRQRRPNVLWWSVAPWVSSGYGIQTREVTRRLKDRGHHVTISTTYGIGGGIQNYNGIQVFPNARHKYGQDVIYGHWQVVDSEQPGPTLMMTLYDVWTLTSDHLEEVPLIGSWVPIDHFPVPPQVLDWCRRPNVYPIAMSQYGQNQLLEHGIQTGFVPHSVDTELFHPGATGPQNMGAREALELGDDRFIVMMNSANASSEADRKAFWEQLLAFSIFAKNHDDVLLYLHTYLTDPSGQDIPKILEFLGIKDRVSVTDQFSYIMNGIPDQMLAAMYADADVLLCASKGEGFGIPVIEAQACGTPVIVNQGTAQPELVGDGWIVEGQPAWDRLQAACWQVPSVASIVMALEAAYERGVGNKSEKAREFALDFDHDVVFDRFWNPTMDHLAGMFPDETSLVGA